MVCQKNQTTLKKPQTDVFGIALCLASLAGYFVTAVVLRVVLVLVRFCVLCLVSLMYMFDLFVSPVASSRGGWVSFAFVSL